MASGKPLRAAIYARVSTFDQQPENQLQELRSTPVSHAPGRRASAWGGGARFPRQCQ